MTPHDGHHMTGRDPTTLAELINQHGEEIWAGPDSAANGYDRGDRNRRPELLDTPTDRRRNRRAALT